jgi:hypothetical protein
MAMAFSRAARAAMLLAALAGAARVPASSEHMSL